MANWEWPTISDKLEAIGYLAVPGVVGSIEATVPKGKTDKFREEYKGKYSDEYPYEAEKYGRQFRIYLNDTDGCPNFLKEHLDGTYGNRINNTSFIDELVKEYGFKFTKDPQDTEMIMRCVSLKHKLPEMEAFQKGLYGYKEFVQQIEALVNNASVLVSPNLYEYRERTISKKRIEKLVNRRDMSSLSGFTPNQMLRLGWSGEEYIAYLLKTRNSKILKGLGISDNASFTFEWFNEGVQNADKLRTIVNNHGRNPFSEIVKKWDDKSIGKGCDIVVKLETGKLIYVEVKTSKRAYPYFNMTSAEMQQMELRGDQYVLVKINNFENLLNGDAPDIITIVNPFEKIFHPMYMKEATFIVGGKSL